MKETLVETLRKVPWLASLPDADLDMLGHAFAISEHEDGYVFVKEGRHADGAYLILSGEVLVTRRRGHLEDEVNRLGPGELFGLIALMDDKGRSATCHAIGHTKAAHLESGAFQLLMNAEAPAARAVQLAVIDQLCHDFRHLVGDLRAEIEKHG
jgi:CRP-like cAMP-binding protein